MSNLEKLQATNKNMVVWTRFKPSSADPMKYDLSVHHITMRSVMASLVSIYKNGEIAPQVASKWQKSEDSKEWKVTIDPNWTFENGDKITSEIIVRNFKRILMLKNLDNSKSGFLEFLVEANQLKRIDQNIKGISVLENDIVFTFVKPMPDFLEKVSFGFYSIAHPDNYDENGKWKNDHEVIASGKYRISKWDEQNFILEYRDQMNEHVEYKKIRKIIFNFSDDIAAIESSDIMIREKINPYADPSLWTYASTSQDNNITYIKVEKWNNPKSLLFDRKVRTTLRNIFYESLEKAGLEVTKSFFPLSIVGVKPFIYDKGLSFDWKNKDFTTQPFFVSKKSEKKELGNIYKEAFQEFNEKINGIAKNVDYPINEEDEKRIFDIQFLGTGILIDAPKDDIRFMFMSKQGIKLPDETGEIIKKLERDDFDIQEINKILWEQAIIWPVRHSSIGFWTKNSSKIDVSDLNLTLHPIDFQFLYWK